LKYLLVQPAYPTPTKSLNHKDYFPVGLLKIAALLLSKKIEVHLVYGFEQKKEIPFKPDEIWISSLFTYWILDVKDCVDYYRNLYPDATIVVGGIASALLGDRKTMEITECDFVANGLDEEAEIVEKEYFIEAYKKFANHVNFQILHGQRGCVNRCKFCGTWIVEPEFKCKKSIKEEIFKRKLIFYDNNFLANENIRDILKELIELKKQKKILWCECQSGLDGRILLKNKDLAHMLKEAGFRNIRIAWDGGLNQYSKINEQVNILNEAGYKNRDIEVFMIYNWDIPFEEMEKKRIKCWELGVQISDCRYRPLNRWKRDFYNPRIIGQNYGYYIHKKGNWTDAKVKQFRRNVRRHNIAIRQNLNFYSKECERKSIPKKDILRLNKMNEKQAKEFAQKLQITLWFPDYISSPISETELLDSHV